MDTVLLEWVSVHAVRLYTYPDNAFMLFLLLGPLSVLMVGR